VLVSSLACNPTTLGPNSSSTCTVTLTHAAPTGGAVVTVTNTNATLTAPASVTVAAAALTATFNATTAALASNQTATLTAAYNGSSANATISLTASVLVSSLACNPASLGPNASSTCTVTLTKAAPTGGALVTLTNTNATLTAPASVTVAAAALTATFNATTAAIASNQSATLTAAYNSSSANATISLTAFVLVSSLVCNPASLGPNASSTCTVTLTNAAPTGGALVTLTNTNATLTAPASVTVAAAALTATFKATTAAIASNQSATLTAAYNSSSAHAPISLVAQALAVSAVSVTPGSGSGAQQTFALQYADSLEATDLATVWVWFTSNFNTGSSANSCLVYYARASNQLFLLNDAGTVWSPAAPGTAVTLSNSQCSVNAAAASVTVSGTALTLTLPVTFAAGYAGAKNTYMYAAGSSANSGWQAMGSWTVPAGSAPGPVSVAPSSGSGAQQTFALQYADPLGAADLTTVWVWFTSNYNTVSSANACLVSYTRSTNQLSLLNDAGTAWSTPAAPGAAVTLSGSQCSVNAGAASVTVSGTDLILNLPVTFTAAYAGAKSTYMYAAGPSANSGWRNMGSWTVPATGPAPTAVSPSSGSGEQQTFALQYADPLGAADLTTVWVWFTSNYNTVSSANACLVSYTRSTNQLSLLNDAGTAWSTPAAPGAAVTLSGSQCSVNAGAASVTASGTSLTVNLPVTFMAAYAGAKSTYMYAAGPSANSGWRNMGSWTVPATGPAPTAVSATPNSGSGAQQTFALQYADPLGAADLTTVWVWFTSNYNTVSSANACLVSYTRSTNQLSLLNDAGTAWSTPAALGAAVTLSGSQCSVNAGAASVTPSGTDLTLNLPVTFTAAYAGTNSIYMYAAGSSANSGWQNMGSWIVP
jgi:hypothetical protein